MFLSNVYLYFFGLEFHLIIQPSYKFTFNYRKSSFVSKIIQCYLSFTMPNILEATNLKNYIVINHQISGGGEDSSLPLSLVGGKNSPPPHHPNYPTIHLTLKYGKSEVTFNLAQCYKPNSRILMSC